MLLTYEKFESFRHRYQELHRAFCALPFAQMRDHGFVRFRGGFHGEGVLLEAKRNDIPEYDLYFGTDYIGALQNYEPFYRWFWLPAEARAKPDNHDAEFNALPMAHKLWMMILQYRGDAGYAMWSLDPAVLHFTYDYALSIERVLRVPIMDPLLELSDNEATWVAQYDTHLARCLACRKTILGFKKVSAHLKDCKDWHKYDERASTLLSYDAGEFMVKVDFATEQGWLPQT